MKNSTEKTLISFAAIKTFYDETTKDNFFEEIITISVHRVVKNKSKTSAPDITKYAKNNFAEIPESYVKTILKRLKRKGVVQYESFSEVSINPEKKQQVLNTEKKMRSNELQVNKLLKEVIVYLKPNLEERFKKEFDGEKIKKHLIQTLPFAFEEKGESENDIHREILNLIEKEESVKNTFDLFAYGSIVRRVFGEWSSKNVNLDRINVYLDTNILFSLFGINDPESKDEVREFIEMCIKNKIEIKALPITIGEFKDALTMLPDVKTNITFSERNDILHNLEEKLEQEGVEIDYRSLNEKKLKVDEDLKNTLSDLGRERRDYYGAQYHGQKHDETVLSFLKKENSQTGLEKHFLLTRHMSLIEALRKGQGVSNYEDFVYSLEKLYSIIWINSPQSVEGFDIIDLLKISLNKEGVDELYHIPQKMREHIEKLIKDNKDITEQDVLLYASAQEKERLMSEEDLSIEEERRMRERIIRQKEEREETERRLKNAESVISETCKKRWNRMFRIFDLCLCITPAVIIFLIPDFLSKAHFLGKLIIFTCITLLSHIIQKSERFKNFIEKKKNKKVRSCIMKRRSKLFGDPNQVINDEEKRNS